MLIHLNYQPMRPIASYARLGTQAEAPSMVKVWRTKDSNSPNACQEPTYDNEGTNPYCPWNRDHLLESALGFSGGIGQLVHGPGWGRTAQSPGDLVSLMRSGPMETCYILVCVDRYMHHWKRGW